MNDFSVVKKYFFDGIILLIFIIIFVSSNDFENGIRYTFSGNSFLNPVNGEIHDYLGIILQIFSALGILIQLIFINIKILKQK